MIIWRGASLLDGKPIVVVLTHGSRNRKTGRMAQTWILRSDIDPMTAVKLGKDASVCGDCIHRGHGTKSRSCYVNVGQAPLAVYRKFVRGGYSPLDLALLRKILSKHCLRIGSYGDPLAVPAYVWKAILALSSGHTGYTHQWGQDHAVGYKDFLMASCDSLREKEVAQQCGWRTFRVMAKGETCSAGEFVCPASAEQSYRLTCAECKACNGAGKNAKRASVAITVHGNSAIAANGQHKLAALIGLGLSKLGGYSL